jgi:hypothetical protein
MKKIVLIAALTLVASTYALGQTNGQIVDQSKEVKPTVVERPAVEHFYSCPIRYDLKYLVKALPVVNATSTLTSNYLSTEYVDHYVDAPAQDILRAGVPTCVPVPVPVETRYLSSGNIGFDTTALDYNFVFLLSNGKSIRIDLKTGKVELPEGYTTDKAVKEFWEALKLYAKGHTDK